MWPSQFCLKVLPRTPSSVPHHINLHLARPYNQHILCNTVCRANRPCSNVRPYSAFVSHFARKATSSASQRAPWFSLRRVFTTSIFRRANKKALNEGKSVAANGKKGSALKSADVTRLMGLARPEKWKLSGMLLLFLFLYCCCFDLLKFHFIYI